MEARLRCWDVSGYPFYQSILGLVSAYAMDLLFDSLGADARPADVSAALDMLATADEGGRGAVYTRPEVVAAILDLCGYTTDQPLHRLRLLEPSFGCGDFLLPALDRLLESYVQHGGALEEAEAALAPAIRAVELHPESVEQVRIRIVSRLVHVGVSKASANALCEAWLLRDDFLLCPLQGQFDLVVGNPPYVRQERIPAPLLAEYRRRYRTLYDRADLYVPFYERGLDLLAPGGRLGFICANRWIKNRYGGPLRAKISDGFHLSHFIDMEGISAFHEEVIAYPAITVIMRADAGATGPSQVVGAQSIGRSGLAAVVSRLTSGDSGGDAGQVDLPRGNAPWLLDDLPRLRLLRRLESTFPLLEEAGCRVGIGVATGCDRVFIGDYDALPVEAERKLPLAMARDMEDGRISWRGKGVLNPFDADGRLVSLADYPRFAAYLREHRDAVASRHVAGRNPDGWYRTIDRITPSLVSRPKLLVPDIKGEAVFALDDGRFYPHHNLYYITSDDWDLRALRTVLRSSLSVMIVATYCTRMAGGFLRFQAQYLRRLRLPRWEQVPAPQRAALHAANTSMDISVVDAPVFSLFGLSREEGEYVRKIADEAQVTGRHRREAA